MQYRLYRLVMTCFSSSGLRIQYQLPPSPPSSSWSLASHSWGCPSGRQRQNLKIEASELRAANTTRVSATPHRLTTPPAVKTHRWSEDFVFMALLSERDDFTPLLPTPFPTANLLPRHT